MYHVTTCITNQGKYFNSARSTQFPEATTFSMHAQKCLRTRVELQTAKGLVLLLLA